MRTNVKLNPDEFQKIVQDVEKTEFPNRTALWEAVAATEWAKNLKKGGFGAAYFMQQAKKLSIEIKTPVGARGFLANTEKVYRGPKKRKKIGITDTARQYFSERFPGYENVVSRAGEGHVRSMVKLNCLDCTNNSRLEIAGCQIQKCAFYEIRPYKAA